ncbi:MAG: tetratricopeptide repeat protein [Myxococcota bacterium]
MADARTPPPHRSSRPHGPRHERPEAETVALGSTADAIPPVDASIPLASGSTLERFEIRAMLGEGGMGRVYRAHDPELDREIALKLMLRPTEPDAQAWLLREARAMARLSHPNVLPIYDVGYTPGPLGTSTLFIAMEFVDGQTLRQWRQAQARTVAEILAVFVEAGRGLAAAHEVGLVHRDFKPSNVIVGRDGRVRVMDFGLARAFDASLGVREGLVGHWPPDPTTLHRGFSRTGALLGTPAYMAPEQHQGHDVDERGDQYSFCVALWETLYDRRPFAGSSPAQLLEAKLNTQPIAPDHGQAVPRWLHDVVRRGLSPEPAARYDSMVTMLRELDRRSAHARRHTRRLAGIAALLGLATLGQQVTLSGPDSRCPDAQQRLVGVWDQATRARLGATWLETAALDDAEQAWSHVALSLDDYATRWARMHADVCATAPGVDDMRLRCLEDRLRHLRTAVDVLGSGDIAVLREATMIVSQLPVLDRCRASGALDAEVHLPDDLRVRAAIQAARQRLAQARVLQIAGRFDEGLALAQSAQSQAQNLGYDPLRAEAALREGKLLHRLGRYPKAVETIREAYFDASREGIDTIAAEAAVELVYVIGHLQAEPQKVEPWIRHATTRVERLGDPRLETSLLHHIGAVHSAQGEYTEAIAAYRRALAASEQTLGSSDPSLARLLNDLGRAHRAKFEYPLAMKAYRRALSIGEQSLGPQHPVTADALHNIGFIDHHQGRYEQAMAHYRRALAIRERVLEPPHPDTANSYYVIGHVHHDRFEYERALEAYQRAYSIWAQALGPTHPESVAGLDAVATAYQRLKRYDEALETLEQAVFIREHVLDPQHPHISNSLRIMGWIYLEQARYPEAIRVLERALSLREHSVGRDHPQTTEILGLLGKAHLLRGAYEQAQQAFSRARRIRARDPDTRPESLADSINDVADVHAALGHHAQAEKEYHQALALQRQSDRVDSEARAVPRIGLGRIRLAQGRLDRAIDHLEDAVTLLADEPPSLRRAEARFSLARALDRAGREPARARKLAVTARDDYLAAAGDQRASIEALDAWLHARTP